MKIREKIFAAGVAAAMAANMLCVTSLGNAADTMKFEFEDAKYSSDVLLEDNYLYMQNDGTIDLTVNVPESGMYDVVICMAGVGGTKQQAMSVDGVAQGNISCPEATKCEEHKVATIKLTAGEHVISIARSWGWTKFDYLTLSPQTVPELHATNTACDPNITPEAASLLDYLHSVYGKNIISGQQEYYGVSRDDEFNFIENLSGELPAIRGFDFGDTCPLYAWDDGVTKRMISWAKDKNGIVTASWHVNVPKKMADYTVGSKMGWEQTTYDQTTDFVVANCWKEGTKEYGFFEEAVKNMATELQKLQDANVPVLFRPFHEAEGNGGADGAGSWFWWSKDGAEDYVTLYRYLVDKLQNEYNLHNLLYEFNSYAYNEDSALFYPGDDYVDLVGYDKYNAKNWSTGVTTPNLSAISGTFWALVELYNGEKMVAMMENDTIPAVENLQEEKAYWLYFMPWYGEHLMDTNYNTPDSLKAIYQSDYVITLDELPANLYTNSDIVTTTKDPSVTTTTKETTTKVTTEPIVVEGADMASIKKSSNATVVNFGRAMDDTMYLVLDAKDIDYANGCLGAGGEVNGTYYWVSAQWEIKEAGSKVIATAKWDEPYNITYNAGEDEVDVDSALGKQIIDMVKKETSAQFQVWYAGNGASAAPTSNVDIVAAYTLNGEAPATTTAVTTTTDYLTTTETTEVPPETQTTLTTPEEVTTTETTTVTTEDCGDVNVRYGDVNMDGKVDLADAVTLSKYLAKNVTLSNAVLAAADTSKDGLVNDTDVDLLMKFCVMLITEF